MNGPAASARATRKGGGGKAGLGAASEFSVRQLRVDASGEDGGDETATGRLLGRESTAGSGLPLQASGTNLLSYSYDLTQPVVQIGCHVVEDAAREQVLPDTSNAVRVVSTGRKNDGGVKSSEVRQAVEV